MSVPTIANNLAGHPCRYGTAMLKVALLGRFEIRLDEQPLELASSPVQLLFAYLLLNRDRAHRRERLAGLLWPDSLEGTARKNLRNAIWRLRKTVGDDYLSTDRNAVSFNTSASYRLDVAELEAEPDDIKQLIAAVSRYQGHLLPGFYEEWVQSERERIQTLFERRIHALLEELSAAGRWDDLLAWAERWIAQERAPEPAFRALMLGHARLGDRAGMAAAYRRCLQALDEELGVRPSAETESLYRQLARSDGPQTEVLEREEPPLETGSPELSPAGSTLHLPLPAAPLIGREKELAELGRLLTGEPEHRLVTILGPGGIGKTRLALETASAVTAAAGPFPDGAHFVPLAPLKEADHILPTLATSIGLRFHSIGAPRQQLLDYLRQKELLLVMDNFEHVLEGGELLAHILDTAPGVKVLVTTRQRLRLSVETLYPLAGLNFPGQGVRQAEEIKSYGAVKLLLHTFKLARPDLPPDSEELVHAARVCRQVRGMPLAIILAGSWLEMLSLAEIADEIEQGLDILESEMRDLPERQRSVRAAFDYSWKRLAAGETDAFMRLSVFRGGFSRQAAGQVAGADLRTLRSLIDKSLVAAAKPDRYEVHELLRQFAEEKLAAAGHTAGPREAHGRYYLAALARRETDLKARRQLEALDEIERDLENIRAAWEWALLHERSDLIDQALESLYLFLDFRGRYHESADFFRAAQEHLGRQRESRLWGRLLARHVFIKSRQGSDFEGIGANGETALAIARRLQDRPEIALALLALGWLNCSVRFDYPTALRQFDESLAHYQALEDDFYVARVLHRIGYASGLIAGPDSLAQYMKYTRQSLDVARRSGNRAELPHILSNLGSGCLGTGDYKAAEAYNLEAVAMTREIGESVTLGHSLALLAVARFLTGDLESALKLASEGLAIATEINHPNTQAYALAVLSLRATVTGEPAIGLELARKGEEKPTNFFGETLIEWALALVYCTQGQVDKARPVVGRYLARCLHFAWLGVLPWSLPMAGIILARQGRPERAANLLGLFDTHPFSPTGWAKTWPPLEKLRSELTSTLGSPGYRAAWETGRELDLGKTAAELAAEFN